MNIEEYVVQAVLDMLDGFADWHKEQSSKRCAVCDSKFPDDDSPRFRCWKCAVDDDDPNKINYWVLDTDYACGVKPGFVAWFETEEIAGYVPGEFQEEG